MESPNYDMYQQNTPVPPQRPDFLKILCILSFVCCGLWILVCIIGSMVLSLDQEAIDKVWPQIAQSNPQFEEVDGVQFFHNFGMWCIYMLIANIFSLLGVIMMWRLERIGFFIYAIAELATNFFKFDMGPQQNESLAGTILFIFIDLVFITLYFVNLKHMNKKNNNTFIQSGS